MQVGRCGRKRRPVCNGVDRGSNFAPRRKAADFLQVSHGENTEQTVNRGSVYNGSPRATGVLGPGNRYGPCAELSSGAEAFGQTPASVTGRVWGLSGVR